MKLIFMIACLLFATNVYADQAQEADSASAVRQESPQAPTDWVDADAKPRFNQDDSQEPTYGDEEQPSFQPEPR